MSEVKRLHRRHALVVGGSIHDRLATREVLLARGFQVTMDRSQRRGLRRLGTHPFDVCALYLVPATRPEELRRRYLQAARATGAELFVMDGASAHAQVRTREPV